MRATPAKKGNGQVREGLNKGEEKLWGGLTESIDWWKYATLLLQGWLKADWPAGDRFRCRCSGDGASAGTYCACWWPVSAQMQRCWCGPELASAGEVGWSSS